MEILDRTRRARPSGGCILLLAVLFQGCVGAPSSEEMEEKIDAYTDRGGYRATEHHHVVSLRESWRHDRADLDVSLLAPTQPGPYPLIIYLPGIGENAESGALWRHTWAKAGYAVLAIQPAEVNRALISPYRLHSGDLRAIGRQLFSARSLEGRLGHVAWALEEVMRRLKGKLSPFATVDPTRIVVTGFELGAQTAVRIASEPATSSAVPVGFLPPRAVIALSPYFPVAEGRSAFAPSGFHGPLLSITGSDDEDPYGITPTTLRTELWKELPLGEKFQLWLQGGKHATLAGAPFDRTDLPPEQPDERKLSPDERFGSSAVGSTPAFPGGTSEGRAEGNDKRAEGPARRPYYRHIAIVRSVSLAFLDHVVKGRAEALTWLKRDAAFWIGRAGRLQRK